MKPERYIYSTRLNLKANVSTWNRRVHPQHAIAIASNVTRFYGVIFGSNVLVETSALWATRGVNG